MATINNINQAICESRESEKIIRFANENEFVPFLVHMINEGQIWGVYIAEDGEVVAEDLWGEIYEAVLKDHPSHFPTDEGWDVE